MYKDVTNKHIWENVLLDFNKVRCNILTSLILK